MKRLLVLACLVVAAARPTDQAKAKLKKFESDTASRIETSSATSGEAVGANVAVGAIVGLGVVADCVPAGSLSQASPSLWACPAFVICQSVKGAGESRRMTKLVPESEWDASHGGAARRRAVARTRGHARGHSRELEPHSLVRHDAREVSGRGYLIIKEILCTQSGQRKAGGTDRTTDPLFLGADLGRCSYRSLRHPMDMSACVNQAVCRAARGPAASRYRAGVASMAWRFDASRCFQHGWKP